MMRLCSHRDWHSSCGHIETDSLGVTELCSHGNQQFEQDGNVFMFKTKTAWAFWNCVHVEINTTRAWLDCVHMEINTTRAWLDCVHMEINTIWACLDWVHINTNTARAWWDCAHVETDAASAFWGCVRVDTNVYMPVDVDTRVYIPVDVDTSVHAGWCGHQCTCQSMWTPVGSLHHSAPPGHNAQLLQPTVMCRKL